MDVKLKLRGAALCVFIVLSVVAMAGCMRTPQQKEARFLDRGKAYLVKKDYSRATLEFRNAVRVMPRDAEAYYQLALAELGAGELNEAAGALGKATELNHGHVAAQVKLAQLLAMSGVKTAIEDGEKRMQDVLRNSPDNVDALDALALNELQLGKWQDAEKHLQEALDRFPKSIASAVEMAKIRFRRGDVAGAEDVLRKATVVAPQSPEAAIALAEYYLLVRRWAEAEVWFQNALKMDRNNVTAVLGVASAEEGLGQTQQAEASYRQVSGLEPRLRHIYGVYLLKEGKRDAAIAEFERLYREDHQDRQARNRLVAADLLVGRAADAEKVLTAALKQNEKDVDALLQRSELLLRATKDKEAERDLLQVLHYKPDSATAHFLLSVVQSMRGNGLRQREELAETVRLDPAFLAARLALARNLLTVHPGMASAKSALDLLNEAPDSQKRQLGYMVERNWVLMALNDQQQARKGIDEGLALDRAPDLVLQDAALRLGSRDYVGARRLAEEVLKRNPQDVRAIRVLMASYLAQKQPAAALQALKAHAAQNPKSVVVQQYLGDWLLSDHQPTAARFAFEAAKAAAPRSEALELELARLDIAERKYDSARQRVNGVLAGDPGSLAARLWLGHIETVTGHVAAAIEQYRKVVEIDSKNVIALNNLAYLLVDSAKDPDTALAYAQRAGELAPNNADVEGTLGWIMYSKGLYDSAQKYLRDAIAKDGGTSTQGAALRKYHLGLTSLKLGNREQGEELIQQAIRMKPDLTAIR